MSDPSFSWYREKYASYSDQLRKHKQTQKLLVLLRLATFLLMIFMPLVFISNNQLISLLLFIPLLVLFLFIVKLSLNMERKGRYLSALIEINLNEIEAKRANYNSFDDGSVFSDPGHPFSLDLDLFGPDSLFQFINRCGTFPGMKMLASILLEPAGKPEVICRRQKAFGELKEKPEFCQHFIAVGKVHLGEQGNWTDLIEYVNSPSRFTKNAILPAASWLLPALTLGSLILALTGLLPFFLFIVLFFVQLGITGFTVRPVNEIHAKVTNRIGSLKKYGELLKIIQDTPFDSPLLKSLQRHLRSGGLPPSEHIKKLSKIVDSLDNRLNIIGGTLLNGILLWDVNCVLQLEKWNRRHRKHLPLWLDSIARMDAYISFSVYAFNNHDFIFPKPSDEGEVIHAVALGHPLIAREERVCNDFSINGNGSFVIITGANMAGKSTFLRTAGVALVLAMAGAPVCAREFRFRIMEVYSSMRTSDSLSKNESYFYAELKRLKDLIERLAAGRQIFVILDEILKGTNSTDKKKGSMALIENMIGLGATGIVATHDLSLTSLEKVFPDKIANKCFEIGIEGEEILFDYLLREGITSKMNALILMKQMGLLPDNTGDQLSIN